MPIVDNDFIVLHGSPPKIEEKKVDSKEVKNISDFYKQQPENITCNHCGYFFIPQNSHMFNCPHCFNSYIQCQKCKKYIENINK
jgi:predicted RNA-binding Zn-ribbon protein involved in translation (DUF1610 family)